MPSGFSATLCGPWPKPDFVAGISPSAFTREEKEKLKINHTSACHNLFPENMYYPFLLCEVKGSDRPIQEAERQARHNASIAARAVIQLYRKISSAELLNRNILAISVSHNNTTVKIFGHFAQIEDENITFFRHRIYAADFTADFAFHDWAKAYKTTRGIYEYFFPKHLQRVASALPKLRQRAVESFTSQLGLDSSVGVASDVTSSMFFTSFAACRRRRALLCFATLLIVCPRDFVVDRTLHSFLCSKGGGTPRKVVVLRLWIPHLRSSPAPFRVILNLTSCLYRVLTVPNVMFGK